MRASGASDGQIKRNTEVQRAMFRIVREQQDSAAAEKQLRELLNEYENTTGASASDARAFVESQLRAALSPSLRSIILADPSSILRKVTCPVLALNGSRDLQVLARLNLPAISAALAGAGNQDYEIAELPMLNHLFQKAGTGLVSEYAVIEQTFAPEALEIMNAWIQRHVK